MTTSHVDTGRACDGVLNTLHSTVYFTGHLADSLAPHGVHDDMAVYLAGRSAALGPVGAGVVTACLAGFSHAMIAGHLPDLWGAVAPETVVEARYRSADRTLRGALGDGTASAEVAEAAALALRAVEGCTRPGRPMYSAHADVSVPDEPHLVLWHAATLLREHRGDCHLDALAAAGLPGLDGLVSHSASPVGMPRDIVMSKRGWSREDWSAAEERLRERGLMDVGGRLTEAGLGLRRQVERDTDRLSSGPYDHLGPAGVERLTELGAALSVAVSGVFPPPLVPFFVRS